MTKSRENPWQFKFSLVLVIVTLFLVFGYFTQSFLEIRKVKPVHVAIERMGGGSSAKEVSPPATSIPEKAEEAIPEQ